MDCPKTVELVSPCQPPILSQKKLNVVQSSVMSAARLSRWDAQRLAWLAVILLDVLAALLVGSQIIAHRADPFDTDEAFHANGGLMLALDLRAGDWRAFAVDSYQQSAYPPGFSWLEAPIFLILGASPLVARMCSLATLLASALVIYAIGLELDARFGWLVGLIAAALTLTAQTILAYAAMAMLEVPGLLVSMTALWTYLRANRRPTVGRLVVASLLMALTVLTKYPYGTVVVPTIAVMEIWAAFSTRRAKQTVRRSLWLWGPFVLAMVIWFAKPYKVAAFFEYANSQSQQVALLSLENLVYYPRSIALHFDPSPVFALATLAAVVWATVRWRDERTRLFLIYLAIGLLEMTVKLQKHPRFIATIAPAAHILTGAMLAWLVAHWREGWARAKSATVAIALALVVCIAASVPVLAERFALFPSLMQTQYQTDSHSNALAAWIDEQLPAGQRVFLVNPWDQFSAAALEWYLATHRPSNVVHFADVFVPSVFLKPFTPENVASLQREMRESGARYVVSLEGGPEGEQVWTDYAGAMGDALVPVTRQEFVIEQWQHSVAQWVKQSLLTREGLERVKSAGRYTMHIQATVYRLAEP
jgi:4-amino-4-deoxy-L-arabinose transferase-like glycosyltransferase